MRGQGTGISYSLSADFIFLVNCCTVCSEQMNSTSYFGKQNQKENVKVLP